MPVKRAIMISVKKRVLTYALRVDVAEGAESRVPNYLSSYGDPKDPDLEAIRQGQVQEVLRSRSVRPEGGERLLELQARVQDQIKAEWESLQDETREGVVSKKIAGRYWDGSTWKQP